MSVIKFELTEQHISLIKNIDFELLFNLVDNDYHSYEGNLFGQSDDKFDDIGLIIYGKPEKEFDPTSSDINVYSEEQKDEMSKLISELPTAFKIMVQTGTFIDGKYKTRHHDINWKKLT